MSKNQVDPQEEWFRRLDLERSHRVPTFVKCDNHRHNKDANSSDPADLTSKAELPPLNQNFSTNTARLVKTHVGWWQIPDVKEDGHVLAAIRATDAKAQVEFAVALKIMEQQQRLLQGLADGLVVGTGASWSIADMQIQIDEFKKKMGL